MEKGYLANEIIELLQLCAWKCKRPLENNAFNYVSEQIGKQQIDRDFTEISDRYLTDLLADALKKERVTRKVEFIKEILFFVGFKDWESFREETLKFKHYLYHSSIDLSQFEQIRTAIVHPSQYHSLIESHISKPLKELQLNHEIISLSDNNIQEVINRISAVISTHPYIIWCLTKNWRPIFESLEYKTQLEEILSSNQVIPIVLDEDLFNKDLVFPQLKKGLNISGMIDIYMALLFIQKGEDGTLDQSENNNHSRQNRGTTIQHQENKGPTIFDSKIEGNTFNFGDTNNYSSKE